jgi:chromatin remodeling complex protein RSC6
MGGGGGGVKSESGRLVALERRFEEIGPSIIRAIEECFGDRLRSSPEARRRTKHSTTRPTTQVSSLPREQEGGEWKVVESRKLKKKRKTAAREAAKKRTTAVPTASGQQPQTRTTGAAKSSADTPTK